MKSDYTIKTSPQFNKEFKKLSTKCHSLDSDFKRLKVALLVDLERNPRLQSKYLQIPRLGKDVKFPVFKVKKFRCKAIPKGNRSGFRFIFILSRKHKLVYFTECYYKTSDDKKENVNRIKEICVNYEMYFFD